MAEELRLFLRTALWAIGAGIVLWIMSLDVPGTVLLAALALALLAFVAMTLLLVPGDTTARGSRRPANLLNRFLGFHERVDERPPLESEVGLVPLGSAWPIVTAAGMVVVGLGLIFGAWLTLPGIGLLAWGGVGWLTQLDRTG